MRKKRSKRYARLPAGEDLHVVAAADRRRQQRRGTVEAATDEPDPELGAAAVAPAAPDAQAHHNGAASPQEEDAGLHWRCGLARLCAAALIASATSFAAFGLLAVAPSSPVTAQGPSAAAAPLKPPDPAPGSDVSAPSPAPPSSPPSVSAGNPLAPPPPSPPGPCWTDVAEYPDIGFCYELKLARPSDIEAACPWHFVYAANRSLGARCTWSGGVCTLSRHAGSQHPLHKPASHFTPVCPRPPPSPPPPPPPPPSPPSPPLPPNLPCGVWCDELDRWKEDPTAKIWSMWGSAWGYRAPHTWGCWEGQDSNFFRMTLAGVTCDRNWAYGALGQPEDRIFKAPSPALMGFDDTIVEECSRLLGLDPWADGGDLNRKLASRCRDAHRNVLRLLAGDHWDMCQNLQWQLCALQGLLPGQGTSQVYFAIAPADLRVGWFRTVQGRFTVGDVFFVEVAVAYYCCANGAEVFRTQIGEPFECELDREAYYDFVRRLSES